MAKAKKPSWKQQAEENLHIAQKVMESLLQVSKQLDEVTEERDTLRREVAFQVGEATRKIDALLMAQEIERARRYCQPVLAGLFPPAPAAAEAC